MINWAILGVLKVAKSSAPRYTPEMLEKLGYDISDYSLVLTHHPDVHKWYFESVNLRVGVGKSWYRCDFFVIKTDGKIEMHEVKGFWRDDALVKIRAAQLRYPEFKFIVVKKDKGGFHLSDAVSPQMTKK